MMLTNLRNNNVWLVAGNFKYDIVKYEHNPEINELINLMYSNFFQPCIPSQVRPSLIDNMYIKTYDKTIHSCNFFRQGDRSYK